LEAIQKVNLRIDLFDVMKVVALSSYLLVIFTSFN